MNNPASGADMPNRRLVNRARVLAVALATVTGVLAVGAGTASAGTVDYGARCYVTSWSGYTGKTLPKSRVRCSSYLSNQYNIVGRSTNGIIVDVYGRTADEFCYRYWTPNQGCERL